LLAVFRELLGQLRPDLRQATRVCVGAVAAAMVASILQTFPGKLEKTMDLAGAAAVAMLLLNASGALIRLGSETIQEISEYGKLLLPVLTAALAAQGGVTTSTALYAGTAMFDSILSGLIGNDLMPMVYLFLALAIGNSALGEDSLKKLRDLVKSFMTWCLKTTLYVYTGFLTLTGVVSGPTDAMALKAAKLTISGMVPVVGGILSDASEAVLVGAGTVKNAVGLYGLFAVLAMWLGPFAEIGAHYLMLKLTGTVCDTFGSKRISGLIQDFATAMGMLLGMTGAVCLMLLISMICFMKGAM
jgi:stage III sporulation protein AE